MNSENPHAPVSASDIGAFVTRMHAEGERLYRDFPWRQTRDAYRILVSEVMLQQTQVGRVVPYYERWIADFPDIESLAAAPLEAVLRAWQGLGYNRRAVSLKRLAEQLADAVLPGERAVLPNDTAALTALPGVGPATAAGVRAFAFGEPDVYLETNVRAVFLHEFFPEADGVTDRSLLPLIAAAAEEADHRGIDPRDWNYALLDYGAWLKANVANPSRRSAHHTRQSPFDGSARQKRARLLRFVMERPGASTEECATTLSEDERAEGRRAVPVGEVVTLLESLEADGLVTRDGECWRVS